MLITPNMLLTAWTSSSDEYNYVQLATNWGLVDLHDHSPGKGVQINGSTGIISGSITPAQISGTGAANGIATLDSNAYVPASELGNVSYLEIGSAGGTITLPSPSSATNRIIQIIANTGVTGSSPVTINGTNIYGLGLSGVTSFVLGIPGANVQLQSDGTNWRMISGQQDSGWLTPTLGSGWVAAYNTPLVRLIGDTVKFQGGAEQTGSPGTTTLTVPTICRPSTTRNLSTITVSTGSGTPIWLQMTNSGILSADGTAVGTGDSITLDGLSYQL